LKKIPFNNVLIIGLGLIGGSLAKILNRKKLTQNIWANDHDFSNIELAKKDKIINGYYLLDDNIETFDLIILCTPLKSYQDIFNKISSKINSQTIFFDIGSIKNFKLKNIPQNFVGCHPIAGSQNTGYINSCENLFANKNFIICDDKSKENVQIIESLINEIGSKPIYINASKHDEIFALVSHLPQFLSFLTFEFSSKNIDNDFFKTAFRLDKSNPEIWEDIFKLNQKNLEFFYEKLFNNFVDLMDDLENFDISKYDELIKKFSIQNSIDDSAFSYFEKNFSWIFFRFLMAISLLKIPEIKTYEYYAGNGFNDFISIINIYHFDKAKFNNLVKQNTHQIINLFNQISQ
jgi:prephenate dehydrogenase